MTWSNKELNGLFALKYIFFFFSSKASWFLLLPGEYWQARKFRVRSWYPPSAIIVTANGRINYSLESQFFFQDFLPSTLMQENSPSQTSVHFTICISTISTIFVLVPPNCLTQGQLSFMQSAERISLATNREVYYTNENSWIRFDSTHRHVSSNRRPFFLVLGQFWQQGAEIFLLGRLENDCVAIFVSKWAQFTLSWRLVLK